MVRVFNAALAAVCVLIIGCSSSSNGDTATDGGGGSNVGATCGQGKFPPANDCDKCVLAACCAEANACAGDDLCMQCVTGGSGAGAACGANKATLSALDCVDKAKINCDACPGGGGGGGGDKCTGLSTGGGIRCGSAADCIPTCAMCCGDGYCHAGC